MARDVEISVGVKDEGLRRFFVIDLVSASEAAFRAIKKVMNVFQSFINEAAESETAIKKLNTALQTSGKFSAQTSKSFQNFANELQKTTKFSDESILSAQSLLLQLTRLDEEGIQRAIKGAIGLSEVFDIDLDTATRKVALALEGNISGLSKYIGKIDESLTPQEQQIAILEKLDKFYQQALASADTFSGRLAILKNSFSDVKEQIGSAITQSPVLIELFKEISKFAFKVANNIGGLRDSIIKFTSQALLFSIESFKLFIDITASAITTIEAFKKLFTDPTAKFSLVSKEDVSILDTFSKGLDELLNKLAIAAVKESEGGDGRVAGEIAANEAIKSSRIGFLEELIGLGDEFIAKKARLKELELKTDQVSLEEKLKLEQEFQAAKVALFHKGLEALQTLSESGSRGLIRIAKAAAIAQITIDSAVAIIKGFAVLGPFGGAAYGAAVAAAAAVQISKILSVGSGAQARANLGITGEKPERDTGPRDKTRTVIKQEFVRGVLQGGETPAGQAPAQEQVPIQINIDGKAIASTVLDLQRRGEFQGRI